RSSGAAGDHDHPGTSPPGHLHGRACPVPRHRQVNLAAIVEGHPEEALALRDHGAILTYGQLRSRVGSLRASLRGLGVEAGDRVAIAIANDSLFVVSYLAVLGVAAVAVPLNPDSPPAELEAQLAAVDVKLTIAAPSGADAARAIDRSGQ